MVGRRNSKLQGWQQAAERSHLHHEHNVDRVDWKWCKTLNTQSLPPVTDSPNKAVHPITSPNSSSNW